MCLDPAIIIRRRQSSQNVAEVDTRKFCCRPRSCGPCSQFCTNSATVRFRSTVSVWGPYYWGPYSTYPPVCRDWHLEPVSIHYSGLRIPEYHK